MICLTEKATGSEDTLPVTPGSGQIIQTLTTLMTTGSVLEMDSVFIRVAITTAVVGMIILAVTIIFFTFVRLPFEMDSKNMFPEVVTLGAIVVNLSHFFSLL